MAFVNEKLTPTRREEISKKKIRNPYGIYENDSDIVSFSNYKDIPRTTLKPMGVQYWGYYEIEYMDCQKKSDSTDDAVFFQSDWSGIK